MDSDDFLMDAMAELTDSFIEEEKPKEKSKPPPPKKRRPPRGRLQSTLSNLSIIMDEFKAPEQPGEQKLEDSIKEYLQFSLDEMKNSFVNEFQSVIATVFGFEECLREFSQDIEEAIEAEVSDAINGLSDSVELLDDDLTSVLQTHFDAICNLIPLSTDTADGMLDITQDTTAIEPQRRQITNDFNLSLGMLNKERGNRLSIDGMQEDFIMNPNKGDIEALEATIYELDKAQLEFDAKVNALDEEQREFRESLQHTENDTTTILPTFKDILDKCNQYKLKAFTDRLRDSSISLPAKTRSVQFLCERLFVDIDEFIQVGKEKVQSPEVHELPTPPQPSDMVLMYRDKLRAVRERRMQMMTADDFDEGY